MEKFAINVMACLAGVLLEGNTFDRIRAAVERWDDAVDAAGEPIAGRDKMAAVSHEIETWGIHFAQWFANLIIELAVSILRISAGQLPAAKGPQ